MNVKKLKELITIEQIIHVMESLGASPKDGTNDNELLFRTICHGGDSHKLYFYKDTKEFHCYSNCGQMDIINVVENVLEVSITKAINYICNQCGIGNFSMIIGFDEEEPTNADLDILNGYNYEAKEVDLTREFKYLDKRLLNRFYKYYHKSFYEDGISIETLHKYGIRYDILEERVIIPHLDELGGLVAIRCRNLKQHLIDEGRKYTPIVIDKQLLSAKTSLYFYGLFYNIENIKRSKKVILLESEKAVMQLDTIMGDSNIGLALMSSSLSMVQVHLLIELGVEEVIIGLDKEYHEYGSKEEKIYAMKVRKAIIDKVKPYFNTSVIWDTEDLLGFKQSPTDKGKDTFLKLYNTRIHIER